jgi:hypothetical protein
MVHPVDPSNTATSVAAAAPAFNIRRLVLFAFIGCAFHLRVYSRVSPPLDATVIARHAEQRCTALEESANEERAAARRFAVGDRSGW